jgi:hypothetical protein
MTATQKNMFQPGFDVLDDRCLPANGLSTQFSLAAHLPDHPNVARS